LIAKNCALLIINGIETLAPGVGCIETSRVEITQGKSVTNADGAGILLASDDDDDPFVPVPR
jgi:hypothetical protein